MYPDSEKHVTDLTNRNSQCTGSCTSAEQCVGVLDCCKIGRLDCWLQSGIVGKHYFEHNDNQNSKKILNVPSIQRLFRSSDYYYYYRVNFLCLYFWHVLVLHTSLSSPSSLSMAVLPIRIYYVDSGSQKCLYGSGSGYGSKWVNTKEDKLHQQNFS